MPVFSRLIYAVLKQPLDVVTALETCECFKHSNLPAKLSLIDLHRKLYFVMGKETSLGDIV